MRIGLPVCGVVLVLAALAAIAWYSYDANRRDALGLADEVIRAQEMRITSEVEAYLAPAPRAIELLRGVLSDGAFLGRAQGAAEAMGWQILFDNPQLALVSYANADGGFMMLRREAGGAIDTKTIERAGDARATTWTRRDPQGVTVAIEADPEDSYDPRTRVWFKDAMEAGDTIAWSQVYIFFTDQRPGVTAAQALRAEDGTVRAVFGVDIALESLSAFLARLSIGRTGRALIVDAEGKVIAHPDLRKTFRRTGETVEPVRLDELGDPVLSRAHSQFRIDGHGRRIVELDGARYLTAAAPVAAAGARNWTTLIVVPEREFVGFVALNNRSTLAMSGGIVLLVVLFAAVLVRQGLRSDRDARLAVEREASRAAQSEAFAALSADAALFDPAREDALRRLTRVVARVLVARRAGVWRRLDTRDAVRLEDCRDREHDGHTAGIVVARDDAAQFFATLDAQSDPILAAVAAADPRVAEFHARCLAPLGTRAVLIVPVRAEDRWVGFLCIEDWSAEGAAAFARTVAGMLAVRYAAARRASVSAVAAAPSIPATPREASQPADLAPPAALGAPRRTALRDAPVPLGDDARLRLFEHVSVLTVLVSDPVALARATTDRDGPSAALSSALERLARAVAAIADAQGVTYAKLSGSRIVLAAGFDAQGADAAACAIAAAALEIREHAVGIFTGLGHRAEFRLGIDCGPAFGARIDAGDGQFNLWGDAVTLSESLAETGLPGAIVVAQSVYERLRERFVFQVRGHFYLGGAGEMSTYLLASRE